MPFARLSGRKDRQMKVTYRFANGEISEVEVSEEIGEVIMSSRRKEHADDERQRYHTERYLDGCDFLSDEITDGVSVEDEIIGRMEENIKKQRFWEIFEQLTPKQMRRVSMRASGLTIQEIAKVEGCNYRAVHDSLELVKKKFEIFFK